MALIDKETIRKEIERKQRIARYQWRPQSEQLCQELLDWLDTLLEQSVEGLKKELDQWRHNYFKGKRDGDYRGEYLERDSQLDLARHFYELGLNARKEK